MKLHDILDRKVTRLKSDDRVQGILITGSLARGTETEFSDLDIIVLYDSNFVVEEVIEGVPVETHYNSRESILLRFMDDVPSCYLYTYGKAVYDPYGELSELTEIARHTLAEFSVKENRKEYLRHKLFALKEKLTAAINLHDTLKISYLIHNNFKVLVECVYAINSLPVPPQGLSYEIYGTLKLKPSANWLKELITLNGIAQAERALNIIDFCKSL